MRTNRIVTVLILAVACCSMLPAATQSKQADESIVRQTFDLAAPRTAEAQTYEMETKVITYAPDGKRINTDTLKLWLKCKPGPAGKGTVPYTCEKFTVQFGSNPEAAVPSLENWTYPFQGGAAGIDEKGQVFGIDHTKFDKLADAKGLPLPVDKAYFVYNTFIDFHSFCNVFAEPIPGGKGIQDLKRVGQKIVHAASFTEPPVNLGSNIAKGSAFKNGEVTLELKGVSIVDGVACAIVAFDSGQSSFQMIINPIPNMEVRTVGSSHYKGDLYIDLATRWVRKMTMDELVVTETSVPMVPTKVCSVIERSSTIRNTTAK